MARQPFCVTVSRNGNFFSWITTGTYMMWIPTRAHLHQAGVEFEGDWPSSPAQARRLGNRFLTAGGLTYLRYGEDDPRRRYPKSYSLEELRKCALEEEVPADRQ